MRFLILLALLGSAFAVPKTVNRIVGGEVTTVENYPFMANMQYGFLGVWFFQACGGSLLTNDFILSAAHCYEYDRPTDWRVRLGTSLATSGGTLFLISQIIMHENYDSPTPINNDVALLRLAVPATLSESINIARIPGPAYNLDDDTDVFAVGWGTIASNGSPSEQLRDVGIKVINQNLCAERYAYLKTLPGYADWPDITDGMLCAGILDVGGKDACQGDSGGPLVHQGDIVVGVTSWGFGCAHEQYPGVNARVSYYSDWIVQNAS